MKTAIITGASSGLGKEFARQVRDVFPEIQCLWLIARRADRLQALSAALPGVVVKPISLDLTAADACDQLTELLEAEQPEVSLLINCAGCGIWGSFDESNLEEQLQMIRQILPDAKTIGILYSTSEVNSQSTLEEYKEAAPEYGFEIIESGVSGAADIPLATDNLLTQVDCLNNLTDNTVVSSLPMILDKANDKGIPVFGSEIEQVRIGCLAAMGLDYIELGKQTGRMAAQVLTGEAQASELPYEIIEEASFYGNSAVAEELGITLPEELTGSAAEMFDSIEDSNS